MSELQRAEDDLQATVHQLAEQVRLLQASQGSRRKWVVGCLICMALMTLGAAVKIRNADLEIHPLGTVAGDDSFQLKLIGRNGTPADVSMILQNVAEATGDDYRLAIKDNAGAELLSIEDGGHIGIGQTAPSYTLHVEGSIADRVAFFYNATGASDNATAIRGEILSYGFGSLGYYKASIGVSGAGVYGNSGTLGAYGVYGRWNASNIGYLGANGVGVFGKGSTHAGSFEGTVAILNATAPGSSPTDMVQLYAEDAGGPPRSELKVRDENGNITVLSPHDFSLIGKPSEEMAWSYHSQRGKKTINVDMLRVVRLVERISGEKLVHLAGVKATQQPAVRNPGLQSQLDDLREQNAKLRAQLERLKKRVTQLSRQR